MYTCIIFHKKTSYPPGVCGQVPHRQRGLLRYLAMLNVPGIDCQKKTFMEEAFNRARHATTSCHWWLGVGLCSCRQPLQSHLQLHEGVEAWCEYGHDHVRRRLLEGQDTCKVLHSDVLDVTPWSMLLKLLGTEHM